MKRERIMKKICALVLVLCLIFSLSACGGKKQEQKDKVDLEYYAKLGKIPEAEYTLGADVDTVTNELKAKMAEADKRPAEEDEEEFYFQVVEGKNNVLLDNGTVDYYYSKSDKDKGIASIVSFDTSYGFKLGTVISEVKNSFHNIKFAEQPIDETNTSYGVYIANGTALTAQFDGVVISFAFQDNQLFATSICYEDWTN